MSYCYIPLSKEGREALEQKARMKRKAREPFVKFFKKVILIVDIAFIVMLIRWGFFGG